MTHRDALLLLARQLIELVAAGKLGEALIPTLIGDRWIRTHCHRRELSCRALGDYYRVTPLERKAPHP